MENIKKIIKFIFKFIVWSFGVLLVLGIILALIPQDWIDNGDGNKTTDTISKVNYSEDQQKIIDNFGFPNAWTITYNLEDEPILEVWKYINLSEAFTFGDGHLIETTEFDFQVPEGMVLMNSKIKPHDVYKLHTIDDLNNLLDAEPTEYFQYNKDVWDGTILYNYDDIIMAGVMDDKLVNISTKSFYISDLEKLNRPEVYEPENQSLIPYVNETFGFSLDFPRSWEGFTVDEEYNIEAGTFYINFILPLSNGDEMPIFTIEAYYEDQGNNLIYAEPLGNNNAYYLYYSHFNGEAPTDTENIMKFNDIINTIEIFDVEVG